MHLLGASCDQLVHRLLVPLAPPALGEGGSLGGGLPRRPRRRSPVCCCSPAGSAAPAPVLLVLVAPLAVDMVHLGGERRRLWPQNRHEAHSRCGCARDHCSQLRDQFLLRAGHSARLLLLHPEGLLLLQLVKQLLLAEPKGMLLLWRLLLCRLGCRLPLKNGQLDRSLN